MGPELPPLGYKPSALAIELNSSKAIAGKEPSRVEFIQLVYNRGVASFSPIIGILTANFSTDTRSFSVQLNHCTSRMRGQPQSRNVKHNDDLQLCWTWHAIDKALFWKLIKHYSLPSEKVRLKTIYEWFKNVTYCVLILADLSLLLPSTLSNGGGGGSMGLPLLTHEPVALKTSNLVGY